MHKIFEAKNLDIYKRLLRILADHVKNVTVLQTQKLFDQAVENGVKILPKDKTALAILDGILKEEQVSDSLQKLQNMYFANLPVAVCPMIKDSETQEIACWKRGDELSVKVGSLINWEGKGAAGSWSDKDGKKATLVDMLKEDK